MRRANFSKSGRSLASSSCNLWIEAEFSTRWPMPGLETTETLGASGGSERLAEFGAAINFGCGEPTYDKISYRQDRNSEH